MVQTEFVLTTSGQTTHPANALLSRAKSRVKPVSTEFFHCSPITKQTLRRTILEENQLWMLSTLPSQGRWPYGSVSVVEKRWSDQQGAFLLRTPAVRRPDEIPSRLFLQRLRINFDEDHHEVFVVRAALVRSAARNDDEIALFDFECLAIDDARATPLAGVGLFWILQLSAKHEHG